MLVFTPASRKTGFKYSIFSSISFSKGLAPQTDGYFLISPAVAKQIQTIPWCPSFLFFLHHRLDGARQLTLASCKLSFSEFIFLSWQPCGACTLNFQLFCCLLLHLIPVLELHRCLVCCMST